MKKWLIIFCFITFGLILFYALMIKNKIDIVQLTKAAEQGVPMAQNNLAGIYVKRKNYTQALKWLRRAAQKNYMIAESNLANMYYTGQGVKKNYTEAAEWYYKAAVQGYIPAQLNLGYAYQTGQGVPQSHAKADEWYCKSIGRKDFVPQTLQEKDLRAACLKVKRKNYKLKIGE